MGQVTITDLRKKCRGGPPWDPYREAGLETLILSDTHERDTSNGPHQAHPLRQRSAVVHDDGNDRGERFLSFGPTAAAYQRGM